MKRREFLEFMGRSAAVGLSSGVLGALAGCAVAGKTAVPEGLWFPPIEPSDKDELLLAKGFSARIVAKWGDPIDAGGSLEFGTNADFNCFVPFDPTKPDDGMLWTNHEYPEPLFVSGFNDRDRATRKTREQVLAEMRSVGGSLVRFRKNSHGVWAIDRTDPRNRRFTAETKIPLVAPRPIEGSLVATGTLANCAGGRTPWGTILSCEENFDQYYGDWDYSPKPGAKKPRTTPFTRFHAEDFGWSQYFDHPPTHYGWVVEIDPRTGEAKKLTALGRFAHEGATCVQAADGRTVVYLGDDANDQCIYKFIAERAGSLEKGTLYVASLERKRWLPLTMDAHPDFKRRFKDQLDLLIQTREAAEILGGSRLDRPEDIEQDPVTKDMIVALTNNKPRGRPHGSLLRISEKDRDPRSLEFEWRTWIAGGPETGISCPDNLAFDSKGHLWITSDMSAADIAKGITKPFKNNGLYCVPMSGPAAGKIFQAISAPVGAELTGPDFLPDGTLLLSVQHPGEGAESPDPKTWSSHWPDGGLSVPKSAVIAVRIPSSL